jgi:hypothetical protein
MNATQNQAAPNNSGRTALMIGGGILATFGTVLSLGGGGILAIGGSDGTFSSGHRDVSTATSALVSDGAKINGVADVTKVLGQPRVRISADSVRTDKNVFVGVGPKAQVDRYLAGASIDTVKDFEVDPWSLSKSTREGTTKPKPPATQSFWVAKSDGSTAAIDWKVRDGNYRVVVMNADGSRGVATQSRFEVEVPHLSTLAVAMLIVGLVTVGGGIAMMVPALRGGGSTKPQAPAFAVS